MYDLAARTHRENASLDARLGRTPRLPRQPFYARFPARSGRSDDGRYPPN